MKLEKLGRNGFFEQKYYEKERFDSSIFKIPANCEK